MLRRVAYLTVVVSVGLALAGCAFNFFDRFERRAAWRDREERACMVRRAVDVTAYVQPTSRIRDRGACGIARPLKVAALAGGGVSIGPEATLNCPLTAAVEGWLARSVQPAAMAWFGMPVVEIKQISAYACRTKNNERGASLSEHAFGNALDVAGFTLANGYTVTVKRDWNGAVNARGFLREVFAAACNQFRTVLGPGVEYHGDHFHLDLAHHGGSGADHYCRPEPDGFNLPRPTYRGPDLIARGPGLLDWTPTGSIGEDAAAYVDP